MQSVRVKVVVVVKLVMVVVVVLKVVVKKKTKNRGSRCEYGDTDGSTCCKAIDHLSATS